MMTSKPPLSFSQMLVRAQWRHEGRSNPPAQAAAPAERRPAAQPLPRLPLLSGASGRS
jgi:hypothetical protein